jgi:CRISPR-associated endoribonuclease Cas6
MQQDIPNEHPNEHPKGHPTGYLIERAANEEKTGRHPMTQLLDSAAADLYSIVVIVTPMRRASVRATMGHQAHAAFLRTIEDSDPALADVLHMPNMPLRPFTVSPLRGTPRASNGRLHLLPGEEYWLRFTILYPPIFQQFMARFLSGRGRPVIRLGSAQLLIKEILATPGSHRWCGHTSWAAIASQVEPEPEIRLQFVSPTAFGFGQKRWGKKVFVLPDPAPVFGSLARSWNSLAPDQVRVDRRALREYVDEHVVIKRIDRLRTRMLRYRRAPQVGFTGRVVYGLMGDDAGGLAPDAIRCQLNALAELAFYCGVGMKTAQGMGQCRRLRPPQSAGGG